VPTSSKDKRTSSIAEEALKRIGDLFSLERTLSVLTPDERRESRLREAVPLLGRFWALVDEYAPQVLPQSMLGKAFTYALNNKDRLMTFLEDGRIEISNAMVENAIRPFAVGRKNWLFAGSPKGAQASACVYSLVETAKANNLDPFLYLRTLLEDIPGFDYQTNPQTMAKLMPWSDHMQAACAAGQKH
jgi:transposase